MYERLITRYNVCESNNIFYNNETFVITIVVNNENNVITSAASNATGI